MSINNPKRIYFDQNKLIDLAKAFNKRKGGEQFQETLDLLNKNVDEGKVIVPLSCLHIVETAKVSNPGRKERLSKFIYKITKNFAILPFFSIREYEIFNFILKNENIVKEEVDINRNIIEQKGIPFALGISLSVPEKFKDIEKEIMDKLYMEETFLAIMNEMISEDLSNKMTAEDETMVSFFEAEGLKIKNLSKEEAYKHIVSDLLSELLITELLTQLKTLEIDSKVFIGKYLSNKDQIIRFIDSIPSIEILAKMILARDKGSKVHRNDVYDIGFLTTAFPYCDIVITENSWCHHLKQEKLDEKYNTLILNDVNDLKNHL